MRALLKPFYHTGFVGRDIDRSVDFYTKVLGMGVTWSMDLEREFICHFNWIEVKGVFRCC